MTLILSVLTREFVMQASDRRLFDLKRRVPLAEGTNKAVLWADRRLLAAYTGLAQVESGVGGQTHLWLAQALLESSTAPDVFGALAQKATATFKSLSLAAKYKRHSFVTVGWNGDAENGLPFYCSVSNCEDDRGEVVAGEPEAHFRVTRRSLDQFERSRIFTAGARVQDGERREIQSHLGSALRSAGGAKACGLVLVRAIRRIALRDHSVGQAVLLSTMPAEGMQSSDQTERLLTLGPEGIPFAPPTDRGPTFFSFPEKVDQPVEYMPMVITQSMIVGGGEIWSGVKPPWWRG